MLKQDGTNRTSAELVEYLNKRTVRGTDTIDQILISICQSSPQFMYGLDSHYKMI